MPFCSAQLAQRVERAEATLIGDAARASAARLARAPFVLELCGGIAACTEPGSPLCKVAGLGFGEVPSDAAWRAVEREYDGRDVEVVAEVASLARPEIVRELSARGYELVGCEHVLGLDLRAFDRARGAPSARAAAAAAIRIERITDGEERLWTDTVLDGFATPDAQGVPSHEAFPRDALERAITDMTRAGGVQRQLARLDGRVAGAASMRTSDGIAQLCGAATLPPLRRRGVQSALLDWRLAEAARLGCDLAVVTTQPGSKSQQNVMQLGFELLYVRTVLVRRADE
ncbi:MAG: N-acetyltransferase [Planctomycetota bacterium]|nr:MAG: N-acetyltransferase [Planctomycetota bacterium]